MAKDDTASGLLAKLVKFVRNPTTNWAELDSVDAGQADGVSKHLLKEMVERKRRNDFVRKREFDMLRKLRQLHTRVQSEPEPGGKPSFFQSSLTSRPDERAVTLKKIDDIEAQMSMQWWKTNNLASSDAGSLHTVNPGGEEVTRPPADSLLPVAYRPTVTLEKETVNMSDVSEQKALLEDFLNMSSQEGSQAATGKTLKGGGETLQALPTFSSAASLIGTAPVVEQSVQDAELEEAAIFFANGDDAGAEASLLKILAPGALRENDVTSWLTLFDLYRATGEQEKFDVAAIEFVERFDRSAPQWLSLRDLNKQLLTPDDKPAHHGAAASHWICPSVLGLQSVAVLNATLGRVAMPWLLDWSHLKTIERAALEPLLKLFGVWAGDAQTQLCFKGAAQLREVLCSATPSGEPETLQLWWLLRLEVLRVMHRPDEFELAALDFCITYEVSPPSWVVARCDFRALGDPDDASGDIALMQSPMTEDVASMFNPVAWDMNSDLGALSYRQAALQIEVELSGQLQGHSAAALERLDASLTSDGRVHIACPRLLRVDFSSAGMLLNWVSARQVENRVVRFTDVNRLIACFFNVIGITEYATVTVRPD
ncbi:MAG: STAS domain-containing protein [Polaromonas sp.]